MKSVCDLDDIQDTACVQVDGRHFYLVRDGGSVRMFSLICPHMGGIVEPKGDLLVCPVHRWKFDARTGQSVVGSKNLREITVSVVDGKVLAELEDGAAQGSALPAGRADVRPDVKVRLLSHACLEIRHNGFTLITDPWLDGPAFHGGWAHYPAPACGPADIRPDALLITHEHSDHCHANSLRQLDKSIPVYFPAFPNRRLDRFLVDLGFTNLHPMLFGEPHEVNEDVRITCYDPQGNWNDSIQLIDVKGWRLLNLNDAGVNFRIAQLVQPVDLISSSFGSGASGFPMCWTHLSQGECEKLLREQIASKIDMLRHAADIYKCPRILLFASFFALHRPEHEAFQRLLTRHKIKPHEIREMLAAEGIEVLDLLPGESWANQNNQIERKGYSRDTFSWDVMSKALGDACSDEAFARAYPSGYVYDEREVVDYFLRFKTLPEIRYVQEYAFELKAVEEGRSHRLIFRIRDADIQRIPAGTPVNLTMEVPVQLLMHLVRHNLSWDELYIGYWCRFHDERPYSVAFWRLLQAPYFARHLDLAAWSSHSTGSSVHGGMAIGEILESHGSLAARILSRHGMYCVGCGRVPMETLAAGARKHGLSENELNDLTGELNHAIRVEQVAQGRHA